MVESVAVARAPRVESHPAPVFEVPMVEIERLSFWYGDEAGAEGRDDGHAEAPDHRVHRALGLRQVDAAPLPQSHERPHRRRADRGQHPHRRHRHPGSGLDVTDLRKRVGMVFQKSNPFPKSIFENVAYGPRILGVSGRNDLEGIVERSLRAAALWDEVQDRLHESALGLSGGQQQRLCIARAIAVEPDVLLMDEPCSALDPIATARIEELMLELKASYTIVIVTHNMQQAARVSDYTGLHAPGRARRVRGHAAAVHEPA